MLRNRLCHRDSPLETGLRTFALSVDIDGANSRFMCQDEMTYWA